MNPIYCIASPEEHLQSRAEQFRRLDCSEEWISAWIADAEPRVVRVSSTRRRVEDD